MDEDTKSKKFSEEEIRELIVGAAEGMSKWTVVMILVAQAMIAYNEMIDRRWQK